MMVEENGKERGKVMWWWCRCKLQKKMNCILLRKKLKLGAENNLYKEKSDPQKNIYNCSFVSVHMCNNSLAFLFGDLFPLCGGTQAYSLSKK